MNRHLCLAVSLLLGLPTLALARKPNRKAAAPKPAPAEPAEDDTPTGEEEPPGEADMGDPAAGDEEAAAAERPSKLPRRAPLRIAPPEPAAAPTEPAEPPLWPSERGYRWLEKIAGPETLKLLIDRGYLVVYKLDGAPHLAHVQWDLLEPLVRRAPALLEAQAAIQGYRQGRVPEDKEEALRAMLELPALGLATPRIRSAASLLLELLSERKTAGSLPLPERPYVSRPWARDFVHRYNAREVRDPAGLVDPFFLEVLCAPASAAQAKADVLAMVKHRYGSEIGESIERDTKAGQLSDELRGWLLKYLDDNRHALRLVELPVDYAALFQTNKLQQELAELRLASDAFSKDPAFLNVLRSALGPGRAPAETVRVKLAGLHVHAPPHGDAYDPGEKAEISAAYWLDGLKKGQSTAVTELVFIDRGSDGFQILSDRQRSLAGGGPHTFTVWADVTDGRPFAVRVVLHAAGAKPEHRDENVSPSPALDKAISALGEADRALAACRLKDAATAYDAVAQELGSRAGRSGFDRLAADLRARQRRVSEAVNSFEQVQGLLDPIRASASPRECAFSTDYGERARALLRDLPAGCSRDLAPEVNQLLAAAAQRQRDQQTFWDAVERARKLERACRHNDAAERFAAALAVLDADAAAKCGKADAEYTVVQERELPAALAADAIREEFERQLEIAAADADRDPAKALATLNPLLGRLGAHSSGTCYEPQRQRAEALAARAGAAAAGSGTLARLPDSVDSALAAVTRERDRLRAAEEARRKRELAQHAPVALEELPGVPAAAPPVESGEAPPQKAAEAPKPPKGKTAARSSAREEAVRAARQAAAEAEIEDTEAVLAAEKTEVRAEPAKKPARRGKKTRRKP
ncbi:MAG: hypothetical protein HY553_13590 [Elusimicrobia bacterium]|nr:hypothetical protein [Elusimicrobiota bacterium]